MFAGNTKGGVEVEPAVRRAAPSRNSNQRVGLDSLVLCALKDTHLALLGDLSRRVVRQSIRLVNQDRVGAMELSINANSVFLGGKIWISLLQDSAIRLH
jgi:hypothetical protein